MENRICQRRGRSQFSSLFTYTNIEIELYDNAIMRDYEFFQKKGDLRL